MQSKNHPGTQASRHPGTQASRSRGMGSMWDDGVRVEEAKSWKSPQVPLQLQYVCPSGWMGRMSPLSPCQEPVQLVGHIGTGPHRCLGTQMPGHTALKPNACHSLTGLYRWHARTPLDTLGADFASQFPLHPWPSEQRLNSVTQSPKGYSI